MMAENERKASDERRETISRIPAIISQNQSPLHTVNTRTVLLKLISEGCDVNATNILGETPLHAQVMRNNFECIIGLLSRGAELDRRDYKDNTPLHGAILYNAKPIIAKCLVVFGAKTTATNRAGESPLGIVEKSMPSKRRDELMVILSIGSGTSVHATPRTQRISEIRQQLRDESQAQGKLDEDETEGTSQTPTSSKRRKRENVLCLDGGGVRGMILIQQLMAIEEQLDKPIIEYFDWVSGTSTGGILALCLAKGYNVRECMALYFRMKDLVFSGRRPYRSEPLEEMLKDLYGPETPMSAIDKPKLLIPACMADQLPLNLHFFRNYCHPRATRSVHNLQHCLHGPRRSEDDCHTQLMWKAGRATGAAPTYFRSFSSYLDGGLIANNPTLDTMTEIFEFYQHLRSEGIPEIPEIGVVVSLGTGIAPPECVTYFDVYRPETFQELKTAPRILTGFSTLGRMIITQATDADGRAVDRSRAWCESLGIPFFRFSPLLNRYVALDCTDDEILIETLWETRLYVINQAIKVKRVSDILRKSVQSQ
ncbi:85/88 kDa calcium-independent phospholipase A2-like [Paramacrobiotus metropolitanus]|uniref:85/88 kDa calcium-independent phospholipase A2-like n=1 Tax=Paramacrobiotus metropolitanus TaxID=2943436 RepID=UPI0024457FDC|nr:85/88 kDa calcium-independent phospholipase A2-like [Paramacrobiotus metropolitanus]